MTILGRQMKIILSRKGFDSGSGGYPNPIMPNGTLLPLPIPSKNDEIRYTDVKSSNLTLFQILNELNDKKRFKSNSKWHNLNKETKCHLDPDLDRNAYSRNKNWKPAFGQKKQSQTHLTNKNVNRTDLFLFFSWFKRTIETKQGLKYDDNSPDLHIIFGYMQIGEMITEEVEIPKWLEYHPHSRYIKSGEKNNCIYLPIDKLTFNNKLKGAGLFRFNDHLILTKQNFKRSNWDLPDFFRNVDISYHNKDSWKSDYFKSADRGQEFVIEDNELVENCAKEIIIRGV